MLCSYTVCPLERTNSAKRVTSFLLWLSLFTSKDNITGHMLDSMCDLKKVYNNAI